MTRRPGTAIPAAPSGGDELRRIIRANVFVGAFAPLPLLTAPFALVLAVRAAKRSARALNPVLASTARLLFGLLLAAGIALE
ncbi:MAG: hypothetical protein M5U28_42355 [Sandaracinaceae bacterium]|nr:hypothetical protein [Sandaracinaceae bacterium]